MSRPSLITQWLADPNTFSEEDRGELAALIASQPYFVPARLVQAAQQHRQTAWEPGMMNSMQLFSGNWLMTWQYLESCEPLPVVEEIVEAEVEVAEEAGAEGIEAEAQNAEMETVESRMAEEVPAPVLEEVQPVLEDVPVLTEPVAAQPEPIAVAPEMPAEIPLQIVQDYVPQEVPVEVPQEQPAQEEPQPAPQPEGEPEPTPEPVYQQPKPERKPAAADDHIVKPLFTQDYFLAQGIEIPEVSQPEQQEEDQDKSLMVVMSFSEWLMYYKTRNERDKQEQEDKKALKSMWQKEKLAAAMEEENEEIPESVFNMAVNSIAKEDDLMSESLAEVLQKQGKYDKALDMYRKLSLRNPQKSAYFASKIEQINKQIDT